MKKCFLIILFALSGSVFGAEIPILPIDSKFEDFNLKGYAIYIKDSTKSLSLTQIIDQFNRGHGVKPKYAVPNLGFDDTNHWIITKLKNSSGKPFELVFELDFPYTYLDDLSFFLLEGSNIQKTTKNLSWHSSKNSLELPNRNPAFPIILLPDKVYTIILKIWKKDGVLITPLRLQSKRHFLIQTESQQIITGLVSGMQLLAILVGICVFLLNRQLLYLYYAIYVFGITGFILADQGMLNSFFSGNIPNRRQ